QGQNQPRRDDFGLKIGKLSHRTSIKDGLGRHIGSCGPLNRNFLNTAKKNGRLFIESLRGNKLDSALSLKAAATKELTYLFINVNFIG
ncbi:hypothetical protein KBU53_18710, partial [Enterobacter hormaechei subsp. xiangfangensis]|uniref:hypothetical protein n=1 Tax=Enterobacter hormaechei TaxID=158836 RepID=UPI002873FB97